ncbi:MAG: hypothetical protein ACI91V_000455, partial [Lentimonas sp.]
ASASGGFDCEALETLAEAARYEKFQDTRY